MAAHIRAITVFLFKMFVTCSCPREFFPRWDPFACLEAVTAPICLSGRLTNSNRWHAPADTTQHLSWALCQTLMSLPALLGPSHLTTPPLPRDISWCFFVGGLQLMNCYLNIVITGREWPENIVLFFKSRPRRSSTLKTSSLLKSVEPTESPLCRFYPSDSHYYSHPQWYTLSF